MTDTRNNTSHSRYFHARATEEEYQTAQRLAAQCGLTMSKYIRQVCTGHHPKARLSERETEAILTLNDARGELVHIKNALKARSQEERKRLFLNDKFMAYWIQKTQELMDSWNNIIENLSK